MSQSPKKPGLLTLQVTPWVRFLIGGAGALAPVMVNLLVVDMHSLFLDMAKDPRNAVFLVLEYMIKVTVLFAIGGVVAFLNDDEAKPTKLFQLGLGAPAMILAGMNGLAVGDLQTENRRVVAAMSQPAPQAPPAPQPASYPVMPRERLVGPVTPVHDEPWDPGPLSPLLDPIAYPDESPGTVLLGPDVP